MFIAQFRLKTYVQQLLCEVREIFDFAGLHPVREMQKVALGESVDYIRGNMKTAIGVYTPRQVLDIAFRRVPDNGHFLEFGVYRGGTIRYIAQRYREKTIHGFDSFEGLPEGWAGYNMDKGTFSLAGKLPKVPKNVKLHPGWFNDTLPIWLNANPGPLAFVHIDCDLYVSTKAVFDLIAPRIQAGTIIVFDEYLGYPNWRDHEFKAFQEFVTRHQVRYEYLAYARIQTAVQITAIDRTAASG